MARRADIDGRQLILDAALKLFADEGVEGVSIRAVNREAGLGPASVHYHFGTKEGLLDEVLLVHGGDVRAAIAERARAVQAAGPSADARDLVMMYADPYLELMAAHPRTGVQWVRLISRLTQTDPDRISERTTTRLTQEAAAAVYPDAESDVVARAIRMCFQLLVSQLAQAGSGRRGRAGLDVDLLVEFLSGGVDAALRGGAPKSA